MYQERLTGIYQHRPELIKLLYYDGAREPGEARAPPRYRGPPCRHTLGNDVTNDGGP